MSGSKIIKLSQTEIQTLFELVIPPSSLQENCLKFWLDSYRVSPFAGVICNTNYKESYRKTIDHLLQRGAQIRCLVSKQDRDSLFGFICYEHGIREYSDLSNTIPCIHYIYVKDANQDAKGLRGRGLAGHMIRECFPRHQAKKRMKFFYTFRTRAAQLFFKDRYTCDLAFKPEIARRSDAYVGNSKEYQANKR